MSSSNAIGTGAVIITANADEMESGLTKATGSIQRWAKNSSKIAESATAGSGLVGKIIGGAQGLDGISLGGAGKSIGSMFGGGIGTALGGPIGAGIGAAVGGAIVGGAGDFLESATRSIKSMAKQGKIADAMGMDSGNFMGLGLAGKKFAGIDQDQFAGVLTKMQGHVHEAATGNQAFEISLERIGLQAGNLSKLSPDLEFLQIADAISKCPDPGQKAAAAIELFGRAGAEMLPMLNKGKAGLSEFIDHEKALGTAIGGKDMEAVQKAAAAIPKIQAIFDGLWNRIVVAVAPAVELIGEGLEWIVDTIVEWSKENFSLEDTIKAMKDVAISSFKAVSIGVAYTWDAIKAGAGVISLITGNLFDAFSGIIKQLQSIVDLSQRLPNHLRPQWVDDLSEGLNDAKKKSDEIAESMKKWGVGAIMDLTNSKSAKDVEKWFKDFLAKLNTPGGHTPKVNNFGVSVAQTTAGTDPGKNLLAGAHEFGSKEAYSLVARYQYSGLDQDVPKQQLEELKRITSGIASLNRAYAEREGSEEEF